MKKAIYLLTTKDYLNSKQRYEKAELKARIYTFLAGQALITALLTMIIWSV